MTIDFIRLHSGRKFHLLKPRVEEIDIKDIAWSLSHLNRFTGHTRIPYSVAEHSVRAADLVPDDLKLTTLLHDAGEAYTGDCHTLLKSMLPQYKEIELRIEKVIARRFGLKFPFPAAVKTADMVMLVTEFRDLMRGASYRDYPFTPMAERIKPWTAQKARREFLKRFNKLSK